MARLPRLSIDGHVHHVLQRGHDDQPVFRAAEDRHAFLSVLAEAAGAESVALHGYALLDNEIQLLATPQHASGLSRLMQALGRRYGARFNRRYGRTGSVWSGRFRCTVVDPGAWVLACLRYVETSALRRGIVAQVADDPWSSARHHLGLHSDPLIREHAAYWSLGNTPFEREAAWADFLRAPADASETRAIAAAVERGWLLGGAEFAREAGLQTARRLSPRRPGRPARGGQSAPD